MGFLGEVIEDQQGRTPLSNVARKTLSKKRCSSGEWICFQIWVWSFLIPRASILKVKEVPVLEPWDIYSWRQNEKAKVIPWLYIFLIIRFYQKTTVEDQSSICLTVFW